MTTLDAGTRARLADALEGATPEMLREDAAALCRISETVRASEFPRKSTAVNDRLAALALAVAEVEKRALGMRSWGEYCDIIDPQWGTTLHSGETLPSALAALLRTSEGA